MKMKKKKNIETILYRKYAWKDGLLKEINMA